MQNDLLTPNSNNNILQECADTKCKCKFLFSRLCYDITFCNLIEFIVFYS